MSNWKAEIDRRIAEKEAAERNRREQEAAQAAAAKAAAEDEYRRWREELKRRGDPRSLSILRVHDHRKSISSSFSITKEELDPFFRAIECSEPGCGVLALLPSIFSVDVSTDEVQMYRRELSWSTPEDGARCKVCRKWFCDEHSHHGVCRLHAFAALQDDPGELVPEPESQPRSWWRKLFE